MEKPLLLLIGKAPRDFSVKTRLAEDVGNEFAVEFYRSFLKDFLTRLPFDRFEAIYFYCDYPEDPFIQDLVSEKIILRSQSSGNLFERIVEAGRQIFREFPDRQLWITGTDIPDFPFDELFLSSGESKRGEYLGPDSDGGVWVLGLNSISLEGLLVKPEPKATVYDRLLKAMKFSSGQPVKSLKEWSDVDTFKDLKDLVERFSSSEYPNISVTFDKYQKQNS